MENFADLFRGLTLNAHQADLPAGLILNNFAIFQGQTLTLMQIADGANIDTAISSVLHIISFLVFGIFLSLCVFIISQGCAFVKPYFIFFSKRVAQFFLAGRIFPTGLFLRVSRPGFSPPLFVP
jgi:hypothetical protein